MPRTRLLAALVVFVVVAAACGGDGSSEQADPAPDPATAVPTSVAEPVADRRDIERLGTEAELAHVQLGDRFAWCVDVQIAWNSNLDALSFVVSAVVVESLIRSDAWATLQQSLTEACQ